MYHAYQQYLLPGANVVAGGSGMTVAKISNNIIVYEYSLNHSCYHILKDLLSEQSMLSSLSRKVKSPIGTPVKGLTHLHSPLLH